MVCPWTRERRDLLFQQALRVSFNSFYTWLRVSLNTNRYGGYGQAGWGFGVRNLVFESPDPFVGIETWIRFEDGDTRAKVTLDEKYGR